MPAISVKKLAQYAAAIEQEFELAEVGDPATVLARLPPPQPGPQTAFLTSDADIAIYGGAAGGGKSWGLLLDFVRYVDYGGYGGVIFRRTYPQIKNEGGLWDTSESLYPALGAYPRESDVEWRFPSGASVRFCHLQHEKNKHEWQGAQLARIGFDELTHFTEGQFWYLLSRARTMIGVKPQIRATTNPDADSWVAALIDWWIDAEGYPVPERSGILRWFVRANGALVWADHADDLRELYPKTQPKSLTFISAKLTDNPKLMEADPDYLANLQAQGAVDRARLLDGNWRARAVAGKFINRGWFELLQYAPEDGREVRFWDFAATAVQTKGDDPDWTVGTRMRRSGRTFTIVDVVRVRVNAGEIEKLVKDTARRDGTLCAVRWEMEGGSSGKIVAASLTVALAGYDCGGIRAKGDKLTRARPFAAQAEAGNVKMVRADWNDAVLAEFHAVPDGDHDDCLDSAAGAFNFLAIDVVHRPPIVRRRY